MKYDPEKAMESIRSEAAGFKTVISFEGSKITGIKAGGSYEEGSKLTAVAVGTGMENASPAAGDTRWVPERAGAGMEKTGKTGTMRLIPSQQHIHSQVITI